MTGNEMAMPGYWYQSQNTPFNILSQVDPLM